MVLSVLLPCPAREGRAYIALQSMEKHMTAGVAIVMSKEQKENNEIVPYGQETGADERKKNTDYCYYNAVLMFAFKRLNILAENRRRTIKLFIC